MLSWCFNVFVFVLQDNTSSAVTGAMCALKGFELSPNRRLCPPLDLVMWHGHLDGV